MSVWLHTWRCYFLVLYMYCNFGQFSACLAKLCVLYLFQTTLLLLLCQHEAVANMKKARSLYVSRHQEHEKARDSAHKAEADSGAQSSGQAKAEKKKKIEEEALYKVASDDFFDYPE